MACTGLLPGSPFCRGKWSFGRGTGGRGKDRGGFARGGTSPEAEIAILKTGSACAAVAAEAPWPGDDGDCAMATGPLCANSRLRYGQRRVK
jgi:hypothetical protein